MHGRRIALRTQSKMLTSVQMRRYAASQDELQEQKELQQSLVAKEGRKFYE